jgi:hypothetical protein
VVLPAALTASDGLDGLLSVQQRLEVKATSATAGFNGPVTSRATWEANVASRISRSVRRNREWAIRSCSSGRPEACERGRPSAPVRGLLWRPAPREPCGLRHSHLGHPFHLSSRLLRAHARVWCERSAIYGRVDEAEKHVADALCEDLGGVCGQKCTK